MTGKTSAGRRATTDEATIRWWLARRSHWNIAVACGSVSWIVVVDADGEDRVDWHEIEGIIEDAFRAVAPKTLIHELDER